MAQPGQRILDDAQHKRYHDLYMKECRKPMDCVPIMMNEFPGLVVTPKQLGDYASERHWAKRRKALIGKAERRASQIVRVMADNLAKQKLAASEQHKAFLERSASIGAKALVKAESMIENVGSARDLASAVNAAAKSAEIYRKAMGLDGEKGASLASTSGHTFVFNFATAPGSPFAPKPVDVAVTEAKDDDTSDESEGSDEPSS